MVAGLRWGWAVILVGLLAAAGAAALRKVPVALMVGLVALGAVGGLLLDVRHELIARTDLPSGPVKILVETLTEPSGRPGNGSVLVKARAIERDGVTSSWDGPAGWLRGDVLGWSRSDRRWVETTMTPTGDPYGSGARRPVVWQGSAVASRPAPDQMGWMNRQAGSARSLILRRLVPEADSGRALLAGFLIGDTSHLSEWEEESMRRSGLSHYVAVSGSNVALFLGALFLVTGPLGWSSVRRAVLGLAGLAFFVLLVGPDPSVLRAAAMAGLILIARPLGLRPDIWKVIGVGVGGLLLLAPQLAFSLGFQLSVAATIGVLVGTGWFTGLKPSWLALSIGAACGAQLAVAPILLATFGELPLWSPVANVLSAPLVVGATGLAGVGTVIGLDPLIGVGAFLARGVLAIAGFFSGFPRIGWIATLILIGLGATAVTSKRLRPYALLAGSLGVCLLTAASFPFFQFSGSPTRPAFVALDVGQGDSLLLLGEQGETVLIDGGSDSTLLREGLARFDVSAIDLLILSHAHFDHYGGLIEMVGSLHIGQVWYAPFPGQSEQYLRLIEDLRTRTRVTVPPLGNHRIGSVGLEVLGPIRRYASLNDQSLVIRATLGRGRVFLSGDMEVFAQSEMDPPQVEVLKVPHQGAATSDPDWLVKTGASVAVVSVGPNRFGHPSAELLDILEEAGMEIRRTDLEGDVVVGFPSGDSTG